MAESPGDGNTCWSNSSSGSPTPAAVPTVHGAGIAVSAACTLGWWHAWLVDAAIASGTAYNPADGKEMFENVAGLAYIGLVGFFLYKVFTRRAQKAREQRIAAGEQGSADDAVSEPSIFEQLRVRLNENIDPNRQTGPLDAFLGAAQAGLIAAGLLMFTSKLQGVLDATELPSAYTARNISLTVRTILTGICWLATFVFAANSLGLLGLTIQWLVFPDSIKEDEEEMARRRAAAEADGPQLPKVGVASKPDEMLRAFEQAERLGKLQSRAATPNGSTAISTTSVAEDNTSMSVSSSFNRTVFSLSHSSNSGRTPSLDGSIEEAEELVASPTPIKKSPFSKQEMIDGAVDLSERMR